MNTVLDDKEKREGVVTQPGVVAPGVLAQPQQPANVFSGKRPATFENMPVTVGWTPNGKPVTEGSNVQQSWQRSNPSNMEGSMPASYTLNSKPLVGVDLGAVGGDKGGTAVFEKDDSQRDGGFFKWLGGLSKKRPGRREGESDDDYDERMTRNNMRIATLADAIRHMGNIYNTSKGAALQKFNSPTAEMQADLDKRKAERARKAAAEADAAYKDANLQIKMDAAEADRAYKAAAEERARAKADTDEKHWQKQFDYRQKKDKDDFEYRKGRDDVKDAQWDASYKLAWYRANKAHGGGDSGNSGGGFGSVTNLSTPNGHMNRKKDLNSIEKKQIRDYLYKNGFITKSAANKYDGALSEQERGAILNGWIGWAANAKGTKADKFRKTLTDHYGYVETKTVNSNNTPAKSNPIRWQGSGSKPKAKAKGGTSKGKGTDWSQYVK